MYIIYEFIYGSIGTPMRPIPFCLYPTMEHYFFSTFLFLHKYIPSETRIAYTQQKLKEAEVDARAAGTLAPKNEQAQRIKKDIEDAVKQFKRKDYYRILGVPRWAIVMIDVE